MANALYDIGRQKFLEGAIAWGTGNIKAALVRSSTYTPNMATHDELTDVTSGGAVVATSANFASKTQTAGVADAADVTFTAVAAGAAIQYIVIYLDSGTPSTSWLIALIDTATGLPVTPGGGDITITWDNGANKIFKL
jgi:hypothetical protein